MKRTRWNFAVLLAVVAGCSSEPSRRQVTTVPAPERQPREAVIEEPKKMEATTPIRVRLKALNGNAVLFIPAWFTAKAGGYDLIVHFHGLSEIQEGNIERAQLNVAVVSVNLGAGTDPYSKPFSKKDVFAALIDEAESEIEQSGRAPNAKMRRLALSAWSAGYVSVAGVMKDPAVSEKVDAILLADGFFTAFTNVRRRTVNEAGIKPMADFAEAAEKNEKLFAITHTTIPTGSFPSVQECVAKLLDMTANTKTPSANVGPREMREIYVVDNGSFHVRGYEGQTAKDHVKQARAMGETLYPFLKARWDKQDVAAKQASPAARAEP
jgi:hypothetical protein